MSVDFLDSNVLIYSFDETDAKRSRTAKELIAMLLASGRGVTSFQVVQETLHSNHP